MNRSALQLLLSGVSALAACTGTDTGNPPVIDFGNSGCHDQRYAAASALESLDKSVPDPLYKGLTCLTWQQVDPRTVRIDLTNYESGCESDRGWTPRAEQRPDGGLDIVLEDNNCIAAACGWCVYDLSFTVQLDEPVTDGEVRVYQRGCEKADASQKAATLALASQPSGAVCDYANRHALNWRGADPGGPKMPCFTAPTPGQQAITCQPGLVCTDVDQTASSSANGGELCLSVCTSNADCDGLTSCESGVCKLRERGLSSSN